MTWLSDRRRGGGILGALGSHHTDCLRTFFGEPESVQASVRVDQPRRGPTATQPERAASPPPTTPARCTTGSRTARPRSSISTRAAPYRWERFEIHGDEATLRWDETGYRLWRLAAGRAARGARDPGRADASAARGRSGAGRAVRRDARPAARRDRRHGADGAELRRRGRGAERARCRARLERFRHAHARGDSAGRGADRSRLKSSRSRSRTRPAGEPARDVFPRPERLDAVRRSAILCGRRRNHRSSPGRARHGGLGRHRQAATDRGLEHAARRLSAAQPGDAPDGGVPREGRRHVLRAADAGRASGSTARSRT